MPLPFKGLRLQCTTATQLNTVIYNDATINCITAGGGEKSNNEKVMQGAYCMVRSVSDVTGATKNSKTLLRPVVKYCNNFWLSVFQCFKQTVTQCRPSVKNCGSLSDAIAVFKVGS